MKFEACGLCTRRGESGKELSFESEGVFRGCRAVATWLWDERAHGVGTRSVSLSTDCPVGGSFTNGCLLSDTLSSQVTLVFS